jgi:hypothetical protein
MIWILLFWFKYFFVIFFKRNKSPLHFFARLCSIRFVLRIYFSAKWIEKRFRVVMYSLSYRNIMAMHWILSFYGSNPAHGEVYSIQLIVIKFVSDLRQVGGFLALKLCTLGFPKTHCRFYREQHWAPHLLRPTLSRSICTLYINKNVDI